MPWCNYKVCIFCRSSPLLIKAPLIIIVSLSQLLLSLPSAAAALFTPASQPTGWLARPTVSQASLLSNPETLYQLNYDKNSWRGDMIAFDINSDAIVSSTGPWGANTAASLLDSTNYDTGRKIVTRNATANVPFRWANLSAAQQLSVGDSTVGPKRLNFVRGDRSNEDPYGALYRARDSVLGDILHANIVFWQHVSGQQRLYVGANDGMLHVFDAATGQEVFAYIPSILIATLKNLSTKLYVHTFFVDGGLSIADFTFADGVKTILVGSLGAGGKGLYALDVSDPTAINEATAATKIKWEITATSTGFTGLGYTYGTPKLGRLNDGTAAVIAGNGYLNAGGHAILYLINADTGALIKAIDTGSGSISSPNGLSTPSLYDNNGDGNVDYVYAGDLDGHLWKFNLSGAVPSLYAVQDNTGGTNALLTTSPLQAVTAAPAVIKHPTGIGQMVVFATGRFLTSADLTSATQQSVYGMWDGATTNIALLTQTMTIATDFIGKTRLLTSLVPNWTKGVTNHNRWKFLLPAGEQITGEMPFEKKGLFYFLTTNPATVNTVPPNGSSWLYEIPMAAGGSPTSPLFDLNVDGVTNSLDLATPCTPSVTVTCVPVAKLIGAGVFSQPTWVEANHFNTLLFTNHADIAYGGGYTVKSVATTVSGAIKTTLTTYSSNGTYTRVEEALSNGQKKITQTYHLSTITTTKVTAGYENLVSLPESANVATSLGNVGRQSWWEIFP